MEVPADGIRIVVVLGSVRQANYTAMSAALVVDELKRRPELRVEVVDPASLRLPLPGMPDAHGDAARLRDQLSGASGIIFCTPEYHGTFSSVIKLVIENLGFPSVLAGKPIGLLGVAAGRIGAIKSLEHLRSVCSHVGALVLPSFVSVANVRNVFDTEGRCTDAAIEGQIRSVATTLVDYLNRHVCPLITLERMLRESGVARV